jgi:hypothetical protein
MFDFKQNKKKYNKNKKKIKYNIIFFMKIKNYLLFLLISWTYLYKIKFGL